MESIIRKHPPRRLQRLEDQQIILSHELLDEKQEEAKQRRFQVNSRKNVFSAYVCLLIRTAQSVEVMTKDSTFLLYSW